MSFDLEMFTDFICPFCYIGFQTVCRLKPEFGFELQWKGFQIHPEWPAAGMPAAQYRRGMDAEMRRATWARIAALGETVGLRMKSPETLANSRLALQAAEYARECGKEEAFAERIYRAYFADGLDIGSQAVLGELAADVGIDRNDLTLALAAPSFELRLKNNAQVAHQRGVDGVPTFFVGQYPLVGAQSEEVMRQILRRYAGKLAT